MDLTFPTLKEQSLEHQALCWQFESRGKRGWQEHKVSLQPCVLTYMHEHKDDALGLACSSRIDHVMAKFRWISYKVFSLSSKVQLISFSV